MNERFNLSEQKCINLSERYSVIKELSKDENYGPIMEIVTGYYGVEYAEMMPFIELLLEQPEYMPQRMGLAKAFRDIRKSIVLRERGVLNIAETLTKLVMIRAGSKNPKPKALAEAREKLLSLPPA